MVYVRIMNEQLKTELIDKGVPAQHLEECIDIVLKKMEIDQCSQEQAITFVLRWVNYARGAK